MKRLGSLLLTLGFTLGFAINTLADTIDIDGITLTYYIDDITDSIIIAACDEDASGDLTIPETIDSYPVTIIGPGAFGNCSKLTTITIPSSVTEIQIVLTAYDDFIVFPWSVSGSSTFTAINVSPNNTYYQSIDGALYSKDGKTLYAVPAGKSGKFDIPQGVTNIGECAFLYCDRLTSITIPDSVTSIGGGAFKYCEALTSTVIPDGVCVIDSCLFYECHSLTSVIIPDSVTSIGSCAFEGCSKLTSIEMTATSSTSSTREVSINDSIGLFAFAGCASLTSITIPERVGTICPYAFTGCASLTSVKVPDSLCTIAKYAFLDCPKLTSIETFSSGFTVPSNRASLGYNHGDDYYLSGYIYGTYDIDTIDTDFADYHIEECAFQGCPSLTSIAIPKGVKDIDSSAFKECVNLTSITIPSSVETIGDSAFFGCTGLTSIVISEGVTSIGRSAFYGCRSLTSVVVPSSVTSIGSAAFYSCIKLTSVTISEGVTAIGSSAFSNCRRLISVTIPSSVKTIGEYAFYFCSQLPTVVIPEGVISIGDHAFDYCDALTFGTLILPSTLTSIGEDVFGDGIVWDEDSDEWVWGNWAKFFYRYF